MECPALEGSYALTFGEETVTCDSSGRPADGTLVLTQQVFLLRGALGALALEGVIFEDSAFTLSASAPQLVTLTGMPGPNGALAGSYAVAADPSACTLSLNWTAAKQ